FVQNITLFVWRSHLPLQRILSHHRCVHRCGGFNSTSPIQCQMWEKFYQNGILKAPLASPPTHISLSVPTDSSLFDWHVGSDSWSEVHILIWW
uniref:Uncharacterized protein n=1 Tax=Aegilops tauschii subsp. strangulata TaxID=200361 RepID=A0A453SYV7_AEGTS